MWDDGAAAGPRVGGGPRQRSSVGKPVWGRRLLFGKRRRCWRSWQGGGGRRDAADARGATRHRLRESPAGSAGVRAARAGATASGARPGIGHLVVRSDGVMVLYPDRRLDGTSVNGDGHEVKLRLVAGWADGHLGPPLCDGARAGRAVCSTAQYGGGLAQAIRPSSGASTTSWPGICRRR